MASVKIVDQATRRASSRAPKHWLRNKQALMNGPDKGEETASRKVKPVETETDSTEGLGRSEAHPTGGYGEQSW